MSIEASSTSSEYVGSPSNSHFKSGTVRVIDWEERDEMETWGEDPAPRGELAVKSS